MRKTRILLASILKPVNDTRMFEKLGQTLAKLPGSEIHIAGQASEITTQTASNIFFHSLSPFPRLSLKRLAAQWEIYKTIHKLKPQAIVVTTAELLPLMALSKVLFQAEIYYDVQENYFKNIVSQPTYPRWLRPLLAYPLRFLEKISAGFISHFFLAERSYAGELTFLGKNNTVLENKFRPEAGFPSSCGFPVAISPINLHLLYSGTISDVYGIWEAIAFADKLYALNNHTKLTIIGYCPQESVFQRLRTLIADKPYITLTGGDRLVPHAEIVKAIGQATVGLLPYRDNESTRHCMPTKLFEYLANCLPVLIPENPLWQELVYESQAGFAIDFENSEPKKILARLTSSMFYPNGRPGNVFWQEEEQKLISIFTQKPTSN